MGIAACRWARRVRKPFLSNGRSGTRVISPFGVTLANDIRLRLDNRTVSMQLDRLFKAGIVERVKAIDMQTREPARGSAYQIAERFFDIWYLMRASRRMRKRLLWLVEFLRIMHTPDELRDRAKRQLELCGLNARDELLRRAAYQFALADALDDKPVTRGRPSPYWMSATWGSGGFLCEKHCWPQSLARGMSWARWPPRFDIRRRSCSISCWRKNRGGGRAEGERGDQ